MNEILKYLKMNGEQLDKEIAVATGISLAAVRLQLTKHVAKCEIGDRAWTDAGIRVRGGDGCF